MAYNENPNAENLRKREIEIIEEEMRQRRKSWIRRHMTAIYIIAGALAALLIFFGIRLFNDNFNPISRFVNSSSKNLGSSFSFEMTTQKNGETMMTYKGKYKADPSKQALRIQYDADYNDHNDYSYSNVIYTDKSGSTFKGNLYKGQWTVTDSTNRVNEFYDFFNDYKNGKFDGGAFLRFTGLNNYLYSIELEKFMDVVKGRLAADSSIAKITTVRENGYTIYTYDINLEEAFNLIRDKGASVFYTSPDYNNFAAKIEANIENIKEASCSFTFNVGPGGYLYELGYEINTGKDSYVMNCSMSEFENAVPLIPDDFYKAANLEKPKE